MEYVIYVLIMYVHMYFTVKVIYSRVTTCQKVRISNIMQWAMEINKVKNRKRCTKVNSGEFR